VSTQSTVSAIKASTRKSKKTTPSSLVQRFFTLDGWTPEDVYAQVDFAKRDVVIWDSRTGKPAFEQKGCEFPVSWSDTAAQIVAQKYFKGPLGTPQREWSLKQLINRVVRQTAIWGRKGGYFGVSGAVTFQAELTYLLVDQRVSFNSPVGSIVSHTLARDAIRLVNRAEYST
jgi:ribonucleoside-diphosphate reductase alpha chain